MASGGFDAQEAHAQGNVRMDGEAITGIVGADAAWSRWLAGVAVSVSEGEGTYDYADIGSGTLESSLTGVHPYARVEVNERVQAWGLLGFGSGEMTLRQEPNGGRSEETVTRTDLEMRLGAVGARGALMEAGETGGVDLALEADAFVVGMDWDRISNEPEATTDASRVRLALEGSRTFALAEGVSLTPGLEAGLRHDGGDAETGTGIEVGGRISYANAASGLSIEASARTLIAHEDSGYDAKSGVHRARCASTRALPGGGSRSAWRPRSAPRRAGWSGCGRFAMRASSRAAATSRRKRGSMPSSATGSLCSAPSRARPTRGWGSRTASGTTGSAGASPRAARRSTSRSVSRGRGPSPPTTTRRPSGG